MEKKSAIAVLGTFDTKSEEHLFLKHRIEQEGLPALTVNVGTKHPPPVEVDYDLFKAINLSSRPPYKDRDNAINAMLQEAKSTINRLYHDGKICGIISAGGGTGTHICTSIMHELPLGVPKVMVSTVASRDMSTIVGTKDIMMIHSVVDLLGVNSISGKILAQAAAAIGAMVLSQWVPKNDKKRIALPFFGFITDGAEATRQALESIGYEVVAFHANGTGGMAMEELAEEGYFHGILDFATHELADSLKNGYCRGIGPGRFEPVAGRSVPRLVVPGGLDCAVLEFTRNNVPKEYKNRKIFFYDFRSAIRLNTDETVLLANQLADRLNKDPSKVKVLIPIRGWSEADKQGGPLYDPAMNQVFTQKLKEILNSQIDIHEVDHHINDPEFARISANMMNAMILNSC